MTDRVEEVLVAITEIVRRELEFPRPVQAEDELLRDLGLDSLGLTVLAVGLEDRFRIRLGLEDSVGVVTAGDLARQIARRLQEAGP
nr:hypothetical protein Hi04_10k_c5202_00022 [uncultured bacterium]